MSVRSRVAVLAWRAWACDRSRHHGGWCGAAVVALLKVLRRRQTAHAAAADLVLKAAAGATSTMRARTSFWKAIMMKSGGVG